MTRPRAPAELAYLVDAIGEDATLLLIELRGGTRVYIPRTPDDASPLSKDIGIIAARRLSRAWDLDHLKVPLAKRWRAHVYRHRGMSYPEIAQALGVSETTVWRLLQPSRHTEQLSLALDT